jgi:hypothetical protein
MREAKAECSAPESAEIVPRAGVTKIPHCKDKRRPVAFLFSRRGLGLLSGTTGQRVVQAQRVQLGDDHPSGGVDVNRPFTIIGASWALSNSQARGWVIGRSRALLDDEPCTAQHSNAN